MGFIEAFTGTLSGTFADQWLDFYQPMQNVSATAAVFPAVPKGQNNGRGANYKGSENIITNGSKIIVPEGTALITLEDGAITGYIEKPGGYIFTSSDPNSKSFFFEGDGIVGSVVKEAVERFKFGGQPGSQQLAFYVNLKEIPNNKFGTQSEIYWDDAFVGSQVGALTRGTYTLKITNPPLFVKNFVPSDYIDANPKVFDFADMDNDAGQQLFNEVVGSLSAAFSNYTNDPSKGNRMSKIQGDQIGFAKSLSQAVEENYQWYSDRGLTICKVAIMAIEYDADTKQLMKKLKEDDAMSVGRRAQTHQQLAFADALKSAGENGGGAGMAFLGMGMNAGNMMMGGMGQPMYGQPQQPMYGQPMQGQYGQPMQGQYGQPMQGQPYPQQPMQGQQMPQQPAPAPAAEDPTQKLIQMKQLLDAGVISQAEFDAAKAKFLGL